MSKINWNVAEKVMDKTVKVAFTGLYFYGVGRLFGVFPKKKEQPVSYEVSYNGAIKAVTKSHILDSYKKQMIDILKKDADDCYYESAIYIITSSMLDSYKLDAIKALNN